MTELRHYRAELDRRQRHSPDAKPTANLRKQILTLAEEMRWPKILDVEGESAWRAEAAFAAAITSQPTQRPSVVVRSPVVRRTEGRECRYSMTPERGVQRFVVSCETAPPAIRTEPPVGATGMHHDADGDHQVDRRLDEPHCAFCGQAFAPGCTDKRYCSNKCRAGASMHRAFVQAAWQALTDRPS
jgi:hypothetical protein